MANKKQKELYNYILECVIPGLKVSTNHSDVELIASLCIGAVLYETKKQTISPEICDSFIKLLGDIVDYNDGTKILELEKYVIDRGKNGNKVFNK